MSDEIPLPILTKTRVLEYIQATLRKFDPNIRLSRLSIEGKEISFHCEGDAFLHSLSRPTPLTVSLESHYRQPDEPVPFMFRTENGAIENNLTKAEFIVLAKTELEQHPELFLSISDMFRHMVKCSSIEVMMRVMEISLSDAESLVNGRMFPYLRSTWIQNFGDLEAEANDQLQARRTKELFSKRKVSLSKPSAKVQTEITKALRPQSSQTKNIVRKTINANTETKLDPAPEKPKCIRKCSNFTLAEIQAMVKEVAPIDALAALRYIKTKGVTFINLRNVSKRKLGAATSALYSGSVERIYRSTYEDICEMLDLDGTILLYEAVALRGRYKKSSACDIDAIVADVKNKSYASLQAFVNYIVETYHPITRELSAILGISEAEANRLQRGLPASVKMQARLITRFNLKINHRGGK